MTWEKLVLEDMEAEAKADPGRAAMWRIPGDGFLLLNWTGAKDDFQYYLVTCPPGEELKKEEGSRQQAQALVDRINTLRCLGAP